MAFSMRLIRRNFGMLTPARLSVSMKASAPGMSAVIHLSLTDDHPYAQAFVIIEALSPVEGPPDTVRTSP